MTDTTIPPVKEPCDLCADIAGNVPANIYVRCYTYSHVFYEMTNPQLQLDITRHDSGYGYDCRFSKNNLRAEDVYITKLKNPVELIKTWLKANAKVEPKVDNGENDYYRDSHNMLKDIIDKLQDDVAACQRQVQDKDRHMADRDRLVESLQQEKAALYSQVQVLMQLLQKTHSE